MYRGISILLILLIARSNAQCPPLYEYVGGRCFAFFSDVSETFADSARTCEYFGGRLARIDDCNILGDLEQYLDTGSITGEFYIDATDVLEEGNFIWSDGTPVPMGAPFWDSRGVGGSYEPQEDDGDDCVALAPLDGFYFHNENCSASYPPLCQQIGTISENCALPFIAVGGGCYEFLSGTYFPYAQARAVCQSRGADLAIIDDCSDFAELINFIQAIDDSDYVWIGGQRESGTWYWNDGRLIPMNVPFWGKDQTFGLEPSGGTTENCVYISSDFKHRFLDISCTQSRSPMCEAELLPTDAP